MTSINNDKQLRAQLDKLDLVQQRKLALQFVKSVINLSHDERIYKAVQLVDKDNYSAEDLTHAYKQLKSITISTYTDCGSEPDWNEQAEHFVAAAAMACLAPESQLPQGKSLIWKTAIQARMARNCQMIECDSGDIDNEAANQYKLTEEFLTTRD
jgi:hypothetical protein